MDDELIAVPGSDLVGLLPNDSPLLLRLAGSTVVHESRGSGPLRSVELRGSYTPLLHIGFPAGDAQISLEVLSNGRFTLHLKEAVLNAFRSERERIHAEELENARRKEEVQRLRREEERRLQEQARLARLREQEEIERQIAERSRILRETLPARHRARIEELGLEYRGIRSATKARNRRVTHCWSCKDGLDNAVDVECALCGWILCTCGACGCGYDRAMV